MSMNDNECVAFRAWLERRIATHGQSERPGASFTFCEGRLTAFRDALDQFERMSIGARQIIMPDFGYGASNDNDVGEG